MSLLRMPPVPRLDPESGENPFAWIVRQAPIVRAQRDAATEQHRKTRSAAQALFNRAPVKP
jgi:hypothetical protein